MSYRVVIPSAGIGSRLGKLTKYVNKSLVSISNKPTISHIIEQFPQDSEFVIALGYKGHLVKDYLEIAHKNLKFFFVNVDHYEGKGSGLGLSLLCCANYLQQPFIFSSCDTLVQGRIPEPSINWMGYGLTDDLSKYRTLNIKNNIVYEICEKGITKHNSKPYVGIAGIHDYEAFWKSMHEGEVEPINQGESYAMKTLLKTSKIYAYKFKWFDTGSIESLQIAKKKYYSPDEPNILEKENEAIWFVGNNVIKYSNNINFISNRVKRAKKLKDFVPIIHSYKSNMYSYKKIEGEILSKILNKSIFEKFLENCKKFWIKKKLNFADQNKFNNNCIKFYKNKTLERLDLFYDNFNKQDNADFVNGNKMPQLRTLINKVDWDWISQGCPGRFHGDFHFENILYSKTNKTFTFLDWRQDFAGDLAIGDIYYDLAKLNHGFIMNHGVIINNKYSAIWNNDTIDYSFDRRDNLADCEAIFHNWINENNYDLNKVKILTGIIFLNIAALHHYPYSILLYGLGKKILNDEI